MIKNLTTKAAKAPLRAVLAGLLASAALASAPGASAGVLSWTVGGGPGEVSVERDGDEFTFGYAYTGSRTEYGHA